MEPYWSEANGHAAHPVKYESEAAVSSFPYCTESSLNFSTSATAYSEDDAEYATGRRNKTSRQDPLSHRIIEKRRRDRMNSCLADLSRLIPPQYQRKGRGRIEKTEIIEMAIRHLKHLQSECLQKESEYRSGYMDCMKEAAKFLYDSQMQDFCYRLLARLQEHIDELFKADCYKSTRSCHMPDNVSASSGSPHQAYHPPLCHLRDMLGASDVEHSNDHNDVKDLSFRNHLNQLQRSQQVAAAAVAAAAVTNASSASNASIEGQSPNKLVVGNGNAITIASANDSVSDNVPTNSVASNTGSSNAASSTTSTSSCLTLAKTSSAAVPITAHPQPHQAPVITSTAPHHHTDSSQPDFDSSREPILHTDTSNMHSPPPRDALQHQHAHLAHNPHTTDSLLSVRMRNYSESSHEIEHNNNYKYKNHIKERFVHELHDEETSSEHAPHLQNEHSHLHALSEHSKDGTEPEIAPIMAKKRKLAEAAAAAAAACNGNLPLDVHSEASNTNPPRSMMLLRDDKPSFSFSDIKDIKSEMHNFNSNSSPLLAKLSAAGAQLSTPSSTTAPIHPRHSFSVPIFALHCQGNYYVPLNVDYNALVPYLNGVDLLEKSYTSMPVVHPININVNFMTSSTSASLLAAAAAAATVAAGKQQNVVATHSATVGANSAAAQDLLRSAAAVTKAKLEQAISNSW
ncbi:transcription factor cwo isoform X2 [Drosophila nasuta]|uniref:Transcription factor cwo isoform X2 n=1 Tax=Drosophila albomicans TaxID=7291 RepID=A0A6P8Z7U8_DROAB|nr:transcription factor cwo isoform X2 [Drosophila albomicans]XP_060645699.1 transcription factor cwo isoform X2 [Drosophila nasuta]